MFKNMIDEKGKGKETKLAKQKTMNEVLKDRDAVIEDICKCIYGNAKCFSIQFGKKSLVFGK